MNKLDFNGGAYRCEVVEGAIFEGNAGNLVAHFATDTITLHDRATRSAVSILSSRTENLQINGSVVSFEQAQTIIENAIKQGGGGGASSADAVSYDNSKSGFSATNVQDAIDEVGAKERKVKYIHIVTADESFMHIQFLDRNELVAIWNAISNGENIEVVVRIVTPAGMDEYTEIYLQLCLHNRRGLRFEALFDSHNLIQPNFVKVKIEIEIPAGDPFNGLMYVYPMEFSLTENEYEQLKTLGSLRGDALYFITD